MSLTFARLRRLVAGSAATALVAVGLVAVAGTPAAVADTQPVAGEPPTVAADALPTVQINGVVWQQALVGNTVYAGGEFSNARPAGAAAGVNTVSRNNLLSFDVTTGVLNSSFNPNANGQVRAVVRSPDGQRVYVGGNFTTISGQSRFRIAAYNAATGALITSFAAGTNGQVRAIAATNSTVYVGGIFTQAGSQPRTRLAAFNASNGALLPWAPTVDLGNLETVSVSALTVSPDGGTVVVGGNFTHVNGTTTDSNGMARLDAITGAKLPFPANARIHNSGPSGSILGLSGDADQFYGVGYTFGRSGGTLEGVFAADWDTGQINWILDCHGDTYAVWPQGDVVYSASHHHYCGNVRDNPQFDTWEFYRGGAMTKRATQVVGREHLGYTNFEGLPAPTRLNWYPDLDTGTYTGQNQGPWAVTGDSRYIVMGGEFMNVNFRRQQGLVRFAVREIAPNDQGPRNQAELFQPVARSIASGTIRIAWPRNEDFDNEFLTYRVLRDGVVVGSAMTRPSRVWDNPWMGYTDTVAPGSTHTYQIRVEDFYANRVTSPSVTATANGSGTLSNYAKAVMTDGASHYWRLGETGGTTTIDTAANDDASTGTTVVKGVPGAIVGDSNAAMTTGGTGGRVVAPQREQNRNTVSVEAWIRTSSTQGGWIAGFGSSSSLTGTSGNRDRQLFMDNSGRLSFGVSPGQNRTVRSPLAYNNNQWHHVVGTLGGDGLKLYVDGALVAQNASYTSGRNYTGFWRIGGDSLTGWPNAPTSGNFAGSIDEVAVYPSVLSAGVIASHHTLGTTGAAGNVPPAAAFTSTTSGLTANLTSSSTDSDGEIVGWAWNYGDGTTGSGATASRTYAAPGTYPVTLTVTDDAGDTDSVTHDVTVSGPTPNEPPVAAFDADVTNLRVDVDGVDSDDPDGTVASYAWTFGDGGTGTGVSTSHTYAAAGTYPVTLTVTDDDGDTDSVTQDVTVTAPPPGTPFAADAFDRTLAGGWGAADPGGTWTLTGGAANFSVAGGQGVMRVGGAGWRLTSALPTLGSTDTDVTATVSLDAAATGSGTDLELGGRTFGVTSGLTSGYWLRAKLLATGVVRASVVAIDGTSVTTLAQANVPGVTYTAAPQQLQLRLQVVGTSPTTIRAKVWLAGTPEPAAWLLAPTNSIAALQGGGGIGLSAYTSSTTTVIPTVVRWDDLAARSSTP